MIELARRPLVPALAAPYRTAWESIVDPIVILKRCKPGDHLKVTNSNGDTDDIVVDRVDLQNQQLIPVYGNAIAFGDVGKVSNASETNRKYRSG
ncbi:MULTISPECIES: hypothetical protein [Inquilinus]|uniref:Uncharacterized protein n=1 Tax=Inquilinus ginsengisoli TaxID=363840 RepID=A0ABU1JQA3_9PROT|nr:hypothetical protein [Inquilinus ginsengisoli]MDR6290791.1 hypothetical protein [Inquilinus ginsengisoli]